MSAANLAVVQHREMLQTLNEENAVLKELLTAHGVQFEAELERRRAERLASRGFRSSPLAGSSVASHGTGVPPGSNGNTYTTPPTTLSTVSDVSPLTNGVERVEISPTHEITPPPHIHMTTTSCEIPPNLDLSAIARNQEPVPAVGGIFEVEPQLQIDFILTYAALACRLYQSMLTSADWNPLAANTPTTCAEGLSPRQTTRTCRSQATL
jgi:hypothetical protein